MTEPLHNEPPERRIPGSPPVPFPEALRFWLRLGCTGFGGPAGQIAQMHEALVERRGWISEQRFLHALNYCMLLPGPEAQQLATYLGWVMHRTAGGIAAGVLFVLPSLLLMILLSWIYATYGHTGVVAGLFDGIKPAVTALVLQAALRIGSRVLRGILAWGLAAASLLGIAVFAVPFPFIVVAAAAVGLLASRVAPGALGAAPGAPAKADERAAPGPTTLPEHTCFRPSRLATVLVVGALLWLLPMAALWVSFGPESTPTLMAWFFSKAALVTFGGAYAVLPYVVQAAVEQYAWLTPSQMIDGLALGETTPGPLIMVVAFVAFVGGHGQAYLGPDQLFAAGALAAVVVTWFTFLPSFIFILAGGPLVESTQGRLGFAAPLAAITAAVVGVIVNLAGFFAWHVFWPQGGAGTFDVQAFAIAVISAVALIRYKRSVLQVLLGAGGAGLLMAMLR